MSLETRTADPHQPVPSDRERRAWVTPSIRVIKAGAAEAGTNNTGRDSVFATS